MAKGDRANKIQEEVYVEGYYIIRQTTRDGIWVVIDGDIMGREFPSLHRARKWCQENPADPEVCGTRF